MSIPHKSSSLLVRAKAPTNNMVDTQGNATLTAQTRGASPKTIVNKEQPP